VFIGTLAILLAFTFFELDFSKRSKTCIAVRNAIRTTDRFVDCRARRSTMIRLWNRIHFCWLTFTRNKLHFGTIGTAFVAVGDAINATHWFEYCQTHAVLLAFALCALDTNTGSFTFIAVCNAIRTTDRFIVCGAQNTLTRSHVCDTSTLCPTLIVIGVAIITTHWFVFIGTLAILLAFTFFELDFSKRSKTCIAVRNAIRTTDRFVDCGARR